MHFTPGDRVHVRVLHADGQPYRSWQAVVEQSTDDCLVTLSLLGSRVHDARGDWITDVRIRGYYWYDRLFNLAEEYEADGSIRELYVNIAAPPIVTAQGFDVTDYELDVSWRPGQPARILDEDEFEIAAVRYGYTPEFQAECRVAVMGALEHIAAWQAGDMPVIWPDLTKIQRLR
jgi:protein associated with RNAse G/E